MARDIPDDDQPRKRELTMRDGKPVPDDQDDEGGDETDESGE